MKALSSINFNNINSSNLAIEILEDEPSNPVVGQLYFNNVLDTVMCFTGTEWLDLGASESGGYNYNDLFNKPIINYIGTTTTPINLSSLPLGIAFVKGTYIYQTGGIQYYSTGLFVIVFDQNKVLKRIIIGDNGISFGLVELNGELRTTLDIETTKSLKCLTTTINGWRTEMIDGVFCEYYVG